MCDASLGQKGLTRQVPLNPGFSPTQVAAAINHLSATHLVIGVETNLPFRPPQSNMPLFTALLDDLNLSTVKSTTVPSLTHVIVADNAAESGHNIFQKVPALTPFENLRSPDTSFPSVEELHNKEVTNIQFTSGTTSAPKAAMLTHSNVLNNGYFIGNGLELTEKDIICCPPPLFHCFGCVLGYSATATHGSAILFSNYSFDPKASLEATAKYRATGLYGVPTMFLSMLALLNSGKLDIPEDGFSRLRTGIAAGSSVPAEVMHKLHRRLNLRDLAICYGMTETSPVSCMTTSADSMDARCETVGKTMPHVHTKVVDPVTRELVPIGERGELAVAGYLVMTGYWGDEKKTQEALVPALDDPADPTSASRIWMLTGDEASMDAEGYVRITGRIKDLIIRGGENISPLEIENCLLSMDEVEDVSVVGVKDAHYGEVVGAFIIRSAAGRDLSNGQIRNWVKERLSKHLGTWFHCLSFARQRATLSLIRCMSQTDILQFLDMSSSLTRSPKPPLAKYRSLHYGGKLRSWSKMAPAGNDHPNLH
jgi:TBC1 domain family member 8/9